MLKTALRLISLGIALAFAVGCVLIAYTVLFVALALHYAFR